MASNMKLNCGDTYPAKAPDWKKEHLARLSIFYREESTPIKELIGFLLNTAGRKSRSKDDLDQVEIVPKIVHEIIAFTNEMWSFSVDSEDMKHVGEYRHTIDQLKKMIREFWSKEREFRTKHRDLLRDQLNFRIFNDWCSRMTMFLSWWYSFLRRIAYEELHEGNFTQLYMQFSMTCFLTPEIGDCFKSKIRISGVKVSGNPGVRFCRFSMNDNPDTVSIVTVAEVRNLDYAKNRCENLQSESFNVHDSLSTNILGQHGVELLMEAKRSFFRPKVAGMICTGSKVIFTFLDMDIDHLKKIKGSDDDDDGDDDEKDKCDDFKSLIYYSRPYDFLNAVDRSEILEAFFWLGYVQSSEYEILKC